MLEPGAAQVFQLTLDGVRDIGTRLGALEGDASSTSSQFAGTPLDASMFGHSHGGQALAHTHRAAHDVFHQTLQGVLKDIATFRDRLLKTVDTYEAQDGDARHALLALAAHQHDAPSAAEQAQQQALGRHPELPTRPAHPAGGGLPGSGPSADRGAPAGPAPDEAAVPGSVPAPLTTHLLPVTTHSGLQ
ncbi:MAG: hypothetical protein JWN17_2907 [Frankiales bacterium]|nr:hypothetical protein [Frankiales bacterium]